MSKILLISDIHTHIEKADHILKNEEYDKCIILGDIFDDFHDTPEINRKVAEWLKPKLYDNKFIIIVGNHEICNYHQYANERIWCSGYHALKDIEINKVLNNEDWNRFKWYYILDDKFLITHAGLHKYHYPDNQPTDFLTVSKWLDKEIKIAIKSLEHKEYHWIYTAGMSRGGPLQEGGFVWCDIKEFIPITGLHQIFGHTPQITPPKWCIGNNKNYYQFLFSNVYSPKIEDYDNKNMSINLCIDTKLNYYAIWNGKELKIKAYSDL
jgi:predicted phosphodiesterase